MDEHEPMTPEDQMARELFQAEPTTTREYMQAMWYRLGRVEVKVTMTNGRVRGVEKMLWALGGGVAVMAVVIAPIFVTLVSSR